METDFQQKLGRRQKCILVLSVLLLTSLVILIFLMVTTTYSRFAELEIKLPAPDTSVENRSSEMAILVTVSQNGELMVGEEKATIQTLETVLEKVASGRDKSKLAILINADKNATHQSVIRVMEIARQAGIFQQALITTSDEN